MSNIILWFQQSTRQQRKLHHHLEQTALAETSQSESIIFPPLISENLTNNTNPVNLHVPDTDSTNTSCQLSESIPDVVAPEAVIIIKKR